MVSLLRKQNILDLKYQDTLSLSFDFGAIAAAAYDVDPRLHVLDAPIEHSIRHSAAQQSMITGLTDQYGDSLDGLSRFIMFRVHYSKLFRTLVSLQEAVA
jgi:hypothetical protein